jgi:zinc/manganese transport system permease protein
MSTLFLPEFSDLLLFTPALLNGFAYALYLPLLGCYLRLRDEILASLAYAQVGAAGALGAMALDIPLNAGGLLSALGVAGAKHQVAYRQPTSNAHIRSNTLYAVVLVLAWSASILMTSNFPLAERLGHALFDGQLLLSGDAYPFASWAICMAGIGILRKITKHLLLAQLFPDIWRLRSRHWRWLHLGFDLLAALSIAVATMHLGVMASFAMMLILPWHTFEHAANWRKACAWAMLGSALAYCAAFGLALVWDQAFGPVLVLCLICFSVIGHQGMKLRIFNRNVVN